MCSDIRRRGRRRWAFVPPHSARARAAHVDARDRALRNHLKQIAAFVIGVCIPRA